jgi:uncharacterized membrane protein YhhN
MSNETALPATQRKGWLGDILLILILGAACFGAALLIIHLMDVKTPGKFFQRMGMSFAFVTVGVLAGGRRTPYGRLILAGLVFGWWGDYWLSFSGWGRFLIGLVTFLTGHVCYLVAFWRYGSKLRVAGIALGVLVFPIVGLFILLMPGIPPSLYPWVILYMCVISGMLAVAIGAISLPGGRIIAAAALSFWISDVFVAYAHFIHRSIWTSWGVTIFYLSAQFAMAASIAATRRGEKNLVKQTVSRP